MRMLVTGCHGFIGGSIGRFAARHGHTILGLGMRSQPERDWPGEYLSVDVAHADLDEVVRAFAPDVVLHAAGTASVARSLERPMDDLRAAVTTWANMLDGVRRSGRHPIVLFPSSAAVYGEPATLPVDEAAAVAPVSPYGFHKAMCELLAREYSRCFGLDILVGRLFSVYGPRQRRLLIWELYRSATGPEPAIVLRGTGEEVRDYLHVDDVATAFLSLASHASRGLTIINIASGSAIRTRDLAQMVADAAGAEKPVYTRGDPQPGNPARWEAAVGRLTRMVATAPRPLATGIRDCVREWGCA